MFTPGERQEIESFVHQELALIEQKVRDQAGSYNFLCSVGGLTMFTHRPVGAVLRSISHFH